MERFGFIYFFRGKTVHMAGHREKSTKATNDFLALKCEKYPQNMDTFGIKDAIRNK